MKISIPKQNVKAKDIQVDLPKKICITFRQGVILVAILIFIITALFTICSALATLHTKRVLDLLEKDIVIEREKFELNNEINKHGEFGFDLNEARLHESENAAIMVNDLFSFYTWICWANMVWAALLIYGVCVKCRIFIIPWIVTSGMTFLFTISIEFAGYTNFYYGFPTEAFILTIIFATIFVNMWLMVVFYYISLKRISCSDDCSTSVIKSNGDIVHTIDVPKINDYELRLV